MSTPVVLLHALSMTPAMWAGQRAVLERAGHLVLCPDLYGRDPAPSLDMLADGLAETLDRHGVGEVVLAGASMGGYVAMAFLRRHPGRTRALALIGTRAGADDELTVAGRHAMAGLVLDPVRRGDVLDSTVPKLVGATTRARRPEVISTVREIVRSVPAGDLAWSLRAIAARPDSFAVLGTVDVPAVVIAGDEDELVPLTEAHRMVAALPGGRLVTVPRAGHLIPLEAPEVVTGTLTELADLVMAG
jgi:pimeloyl-ACP methyl ester carboxylesterase